MVSARRRTGRVKWKYLAGYRSRFARHAGRCWINPRGRICPRSVQGAGDVTGDVTEPRLLCLHDDWIVAVLAYSVPLDDGAFAEFVTVDASLSLNEFDNLSLAEESLLWEL